MHRPVAVVPDVAHLAPAAAARSQTKETRTSSSEQRTLSVPVTTWKAAVGPGSPFGPGAPGGPCGPSAPAGPTLPRSPTGPGRPIGPTPPCGPCGPTGPGGPIFPSLQPATASAATTTDMLKSFRIGATPAPRILATRGPPPTSESPARAAAGLRFG